MKIRHFVAVVMTSAVVTASWAQDTAPTAISADAGWSAIKQCAGIAKDSKRLACVDDVLRKAGLMPANAAAPAAKSSTATTSPSGQPKESRADFGLQPKTFPEATPKSKQSSASERLQLVTLARVDQGGDGKLLLTTTDGAIWKQLESAPIRPLPAGGQTMTIEKAAFGGFLCEPSKYVSFRCFRAQ